MIDIRDLYQEVIIDHNRQPRNFGELPQATHRAEGYNPLCGDRLTLYLNINNGIIEQISFTGTGCAIATASASMLTEQLIGKTVEEAKQLFEDVHTMLTDDRQHNTLGKLDILAGVKSFPIRVKCATLAWHTLQAALKQDHKTISTEE